LEDLKSRRSDSTEADESDIELRGVHGWRSWEERGEGGEKKREGLLVDVGVGSAKPFSLSSASLPQIFASAFFLLLFGLGKSG